ncbi:MAG: terminase [Candidimonas sp.]|nr:MAG: terminase [Candidimonas sp.]TAM23751.1 MAG: terminase [Candidimonas sp.]
MEAKTDELRRTIRHAWTPPPRIRVDEWADQYRKLAKEAGSTSGQWATSTVEVARGPMMAVTEPGVHVITVMVSTQLLKTALLENIFGYFAHLDPCPMLLLQPKEDAAEQFSKERISPLIRVTPVLRALVGTVKTRNADETLLFKSFPGGFLALAGAGSPDNLARRPVRVILADEVDKYPITREGDPITLAEERTATFGVNWLSVRACSPTVEDKSRIASSYESSDQRRASVQCPHCGHRLFLDFFKHVHWEKAGDTHLTKTARIACESCGAIWSEGDRLRALHTVRWHQTRPFESGGRRHVPLDDYDHAWRSGIEDPIAAVWDWWESDRHGVYRARCQVTGQWPVDNEHAGFQASKLYSPWQKDKPSDIARKWIDAQGDEDKLQAWWNTQMGLPHRAHTGKALHVEELIKRCEAYAAPVPDGVAMITVGIDTQDDRLEAEVVGWGRNEESWSIDKEVFEGDIETPAVWDRLDTYLKRIWRRADGRGHTVMAVCIDSGGHHAQRVYDFAKQRLERRIWAIKGESARTGQRSPVWPTKKPSKRNKQSFRPVIIGVNAAKDVIRARLHLPVPAPDEPAPGYMHFPADRDIGYFHQLTAERSVMKVLGGQRYWVWELPSGRANEALDCRVYAYAALCGLLHAGLKLNQRVDRVERHPDMLAPPVASTPNDVTQPPVANKSKRSLVSRLVR